MRTDQPWEDSGWNSTRILQDRQAENMNCHASDVGRWDTIWIVIVEIMCWKIHALKFPELINLCWGERSQAN